MRPQVSPRLCPPQPPLILRRLQAPDSAQATDSDVFPRPRTRSQTVSSTKRARVPDDSLKHPRKKLRPASKKSSPAVEPEEDRGRSRTESPVPHSGDVSQPTTRSSSPLVSTPPLTFLESSASPGYAPERRGPRARTTLPVPVPNLTKKSRGRRVPTQEATEVQGEPKDKRMYVCKVEGCGKCFHRGEHLKRHIRSIHTHEKPFECTHPSCGKFFNRHDNLLQHLKVHKQNSQEDNGNPHPMLNLSPTSPSPSPEPEPTMDRQVESSASEYEEVSPVIPNKPNYPLSYNPYVSSARFDLSCESYNPANMMAISSLRTELPSHSLPTSRIRDSF